jgi:TPR repeat protein
MTTPSFKPHVLLAALFLLFSIPSAVYARSLEDAEKAVRKGDYATAIPIYRALAEKGDVGAQMRLGFFYESGAGLKRDWVQSAWAESADELADIATRHHRLAHVMTSSQIAEAQKLAREWRAKPER